MFGHVERMDKYHLARRVLLAKVSGGWVCSRPRLGWMDGVKVAFCNRGVTVDSAWQYIKDRKKWRALMHEFHLALVHEFHLAILLGTVFFRVAFLCSGGYQLERGGMPLHDAVGINWKGHSYWKSRRRCQAYGLKGVRWWLCLCYLTLHNYPSLMKRESHGSNKMCMYSNKMWSWELISACVETCFCQSIAISESSFFFYYIVYGKARSEEKLIICVVAVGCPCTPSWKAATVLVPLWAWRLPSAWLDPSNRIMLRQQNLRLISGRQTCSSQM